MCKCFETVLNNISEKVKESLPKNSVEFKCDWKGKVLRFDGGLGIGLYIEHDHRNVKNDGTLYKNKKKEENFVALSFCPFCGEDLKEDNDNGN